MICFDFDVVNHLVLHYLYLFYLIDKYYSFLVS